MNATQQNMVSVQRKPIEVYSDDVEFINEVVMRLDALAIYDVEILPTEGFFDLHTKEKQACVIVIDVESDTFLSDERMVESVKTKTGIPIIAVARELTAQDMRSVLKLNATDLLYKPIDGKELVKTVATQASVSMISNSKIKTFISANGGAGSTTLALAAVDRLASKSPDKGLDCCLVDLDFQSAACSVYLNQASEFDLTGVIEDPARLDVEILDVMKMPSPSGFSLYSFELPYLPFSDKGPEFVLKLLDLVAYRYNNIIIDLPNLDTPWQSSVISASDTIYIVFEINLASLRQARRLLQHIRELRGDDLEIRLVANKTKTKWFGNHITVKEMKKLFNQSTIDVVRLEPDLLTEAVNRGMLPSEVQSKSRFQKDVKLLVEGRKDA